MLAMSLQQDYAKSLVLYCPWPNYHLMLDIYYVIVSVLCNLQIGLYSVALAY